jgi:hypothetical protein
LGEGVLSAQATRREIIPISTGEENSLPPQRQIGPSRSIDEEGEEGEGGDGGGTEGEGSGDEAVESEGAGCVAPSRSVKHKAVEQRRKKKISDAVQQLLEALQPPSPAGKIVGDSLIS